MRTGAYALETIHLSAGGSIYQPMSFGEVLKNVNNKLKMEGKDERKIGGIPN
jgi:hypothetical protein